jgi:hypothetical protein
MPPVDATASLAGWQEWLGTYAAEFEGIMPGARIGLLGRAEMDLGRGNLLVWEAQADGMRADIEADSGLSASRADVLLIAEAAAPGQLRSGRPATARTLVHRGKLRLFMLNGREAIEEAGLSDFLEALGLAHPKH